MEAAITKKPIAVTMGDPAGIGPEVVLKTLAEATHGAPVVVIGDVGVLANTAKQLGLDLVVRRIASVAEISGDEGMVEVLSVRSPLIRPPVGEVDATCGLAAFDYIRAAIDLANSGEVSAIVTAPIHKEALAKAGIKYPGHTEILADLGKAKESAMMLANDELRVVLVTIHCALREAISKATFGAQMSAIRLAHDGAMAFGIERPRIAVAGLNPHAGEGGLFGREEIEIIGPAIKASKALGMDVTGPWPGDTVFMQARQGKFDVVVAQYHDQGLIPVKYLGLHEGVNITLGLPFVRTSPDHGTAFDVAGKGIADPASMKTALETADQLVEVREQTDGI